MKKFYLKLALVTSLIAGSKASAQMSGTFSVPGSFPTLAAAVSSLNASGVSGPVIINIAAGYTETAPPSGYSLTATGTSLNPISFQKSGNGANPLLTAFAGGSGTPGTAVQDGVWRLIGSDFITIAGIDIVDLNTSNPATMEFGIGLYKASATDGCQNNFIVNCVITLNRVNNAMGTMPAAHGSRGIDVVNATPWANTSGLVVTSASGANSYNGFYLNTIRNCNYGIAMTGFADVSPYTFSDVENNASANMILDFGGAPTAANPAAGIITTAQQRLVITNNTINNNDGSGVNHSNSLYGISINVADGSLNSVSSNNISLQGGGSGSQVTAIQSTGAINAPGTRVEISGNTIRGCAYTTATSGNFYGIANAAACDTLLLNGNLFFNNSTAGTTGAYYNIFNSAAVGMVMQVSGNIIDTLNFTAASVASTVYNIYNSGSGTANVNMSGNTIRNINFSGAAGATGPYACIYISGDAAIDMLTGNNFSGLSLNSTGPVYMIHHNNNTPVVNVFGNNITPGFTRNGNAGDTYFYYGSSSAASGSASISYNNVMNVSQTGSAAFYGIYNTAGSLQYHEFAGNNFDTISSGSGLTSIISMTGGIASKCYNNTIANVTAGGDIYGIRCSGGLSSNRIYGNSVNSFTSTGASSICPVYLSAATAANVYRNKIYDILSSNAAGSAYGIYVAGGANAAPGQNDTIYNNLVGDIKAPAASGAMPIAGIDVEGGNNVHVWFNTVYLSAASSGSLFGSSALFASTAPGLDLKNNILVNASSSAGLGITSAYRRSGNNLSTYLQGSGNNLFYAGPAAAGNAIFYDGSTAYNFLSAFQTLVAGRDLLSVTENPPFVSTQGANANYLDIDPLIATQVESGAMAVAAVSDDYALAGRNASTPDIGAWENNYTASADLQPPVFFNPLFMSSNCSTTARSLSLSLADVSGVAGGALAPRVYYKINNGAYSSAQGTLLSGTMLNGVWLFSLSYNATAGDLISYYLVAQDAAALPNLLASPAVGFAGSNVNTIVSAPTALYTYSILATPVLSLSSTLFCTGSTGSLTASGTGAASYSWSGPAGYVASGQTAVVNQVSNASAGVYTLTAASADGCMGTATVNIVANQAPVVTASASTSNICAGESASLMASGAVSYSWMPGGVTGNSFGAAPAASTVYTVTGVNAAGCQASAMVSLVVSSCTGINTIAALTAGIGIFPNPSTGMISATLPLDGVKEIVISNPLGETIKRFYTANSSEDIDLAGFAKGVYLIKVLGQSSQATAKIIIE